MGNKMKKFLYIASIYICCLPCFLEARVWTLKSGKTFEAKYKRVFGNKILFIDSEGKKKKVKKRFLSAEDLSFIELKNPPKLDLDIRKKSSLMQYSNRFDTTELPKVFVWEFGARIRKVSSGKYKHPLKLEMFVIAKQLHHNHKFILLDHQIYNISFKDKKKTQIEWWSPRITSVEEYYVVNNMASRGETYKGYLLLVTDPQGKVIAKKVTNKWMLKNVKELRKRSVGNYIDETGTRVYPGRPQAGKYADK